MSSYDNLEIEFIIDIRSNMTIEDKNDQLSAELAGGLYRHKEIVRIERVEIGALGWWIYYRTGSPGGNRGNR